MVVPVMIAVAPLGAKGVQFEGSTFEHPTAMTINTITTLNPHSMWYVSKPSQVSGMLLNSDEDPITNCKMSQV